MNGAWRPGGQPLILLVDDEPAVLASLNDTLRNDFRTRIANSGHRAMELAVLTPRPDLVVLDVEMPGMDGYEVCRLLKEDSRTSEIPVIFLSGRREPDDIMRGLDLGAVDFVSKPVVVPILRARVRNHLRLQEAKQALLDQNRLLEAVVSERTMELTRQTHEVIKTQESTILALGALAETRDNETGNHIKRTQGYVKVLCDALYPLPKWRQGYDQDTFELMWKTAPLHDIGKVGIPDSILLKPGKLTPDEFEVMKTHTVLGQQALGVPDEQVLSGRSFLAIASQVACFHHEKWNGRGYPHSLAGNEIPLPARLMALADVYDALVSARVYKAPMKHEDAMSIIVEERGRQFQPDLVDCFCEHAEVMQKIAQQYAEP